VNALAWRDRANYPNAKTTPLKQWAWEFLRRNPEYRDDWRKYMDCCAKLLAKYGPRLDPTEREPTEFAFSHDDPLGCVYEPPREDRESDEDWRRRVGSGTRSPFGNWLCEKWGIRGALVDPGASKFAGLWCSSGSMVTRVTANPEGSRYTTTKPALRFDLTRPLGPQLEAAERHLRGEQRHFKKQGLLAKSVGARAQSGEKYRGYLQVLDALEARVTVADIGKALFPKQADTYPTYARRQKVRAMISAAEELRDEGYRRLPSLKTREK
jgi:hypothetical protein